MHQILFMTRPATDILYSAYAFSPIAVRGSV